MEYGQTALTKQGRDYLAFCHTGHAPEFTRCKLGSGRIENSRQLYEMTDLINPVAEGTIIGSKVNNDGTATISLSINNLGIEEGFLMSEIGLFANDPRYGEILYSVVNIGDYPDFIPAGNGGEYNSLVDIVIVIGNVTNLVVTIDKSMTFVTLEEFWDLAGEGRTNQTVKNNWDLIKDLELEVLKLAASGVTNIKSNQFKVSFDVLDESEDYVGIYDSRNKRLVI